MAKMLKWAYASWYRTERAMPGADIVGMAACLPLIVWG